jgi:hypothetical protein
MDTATNKRGLRESARAGFDNYSQQHQELPLDLGVVDIVFARGLGVASAVDLWTARVER